MRKAITVVCSLLLSALAIPLVIAGEVVLIDADERYATEKADREMRKAARQPHKNCCPLHR